MNNKDFFISLCKKEIRRNGIDKLLEWINSTDFFTAPASTRFHGNYTGGLCEHSINVYNQLIKLTELYQITVISKETLAIIGLFHDVCKINFYKQSERNIKENQTWKKTFCWDVEDQLPLGHGEKSCILLQRFILLTDEELLAIRWHMGGFDCAVRGGEHSMSKAQTMSPLVTLLSAADILSANILEKTI